MLKIVLAALAAIIVGSSSAFADEYVLPATNSYASVAFPDAWKSSIYDRGVEAISSDNQTYVAVEAINVSNVESAVTNALEYLKSKGVNVMPTSMQKSSVDIGGKQTTTFDWNGTDKNGDCKVGLAVMEVKPSKGLLFIYYATVEGSKNNQDDLASILGSVKGL